LSSVVPPLPKLWSGDPFEFSRVTAMSVSPGLANAKPASTILPSGWIATSEYAPSKPPGLSVTLPPSPKLESS
jgi:hypothetical protein